ncbi:MAG: AAA family ATPase, partial [Nitrososphaeraceae archaeon]
MILAPQELENSASKSAAEAIRLDSQGSKLKAIQFYQRAIEALNKLIQIYPEYKLNKIYLERSNAYLNRIKSLQMSSNVLEDEEAKFVEDIAENDTDNSERKIGSEMRKPKESLGEDFDSLIMKEKPNISWNEVIGLDDAKRAIRESIVYPTKRSDLFPLGWPRGILLYGPPGCGKTLLAAASAAEIDGYFVNVDAAAMMSKWLGEAEKNVSKLFKMANKLCESENIPILLF